MDCLFRLSLSESNLLYKSRTSGQNSFCEKPSSRNIFVNMIWNILNREKYNPVVEFDGFLDTGLDGGAGGVRAALGQQEQETGERSELHPSHWALSWSLWLGSPLLTGTWLTGTLPLTHQQSQMPTRHSKSTPVTLSLSYIYLESSWREFWSACQPVSYWQGSKPETLPRLKAC